MILIFRFLNSIHDDLNSLDDLDSLFDLRKANNALDTELSSWPQPPWKPLFVSLIIKNPFFLWYFAPSLSEALEASLWLLYEKYLLKVKCPLLLNMPSKKNQQNYWSFYPSEPFTIAHFNVRHPVSSSKKQNFIEFWRFWIDLLRCQFLKNNSEMSFFWLKEE